MVFLFSAITLTSLWWSGRGHEEAMLRSRLESSLDTAEVRIEEAVKMRLFVLRSLADQVRAHIQNSEFDRPVFVLMSEPVYNSIPGFRAINWMEPDGTIRWVLPLKGNEGALGKNVKDHPDPAVKATFLKAEKSGRYSVTPVIELFQGGMGVATYFPVFSLEDRVSGYLNGVFQIAPLIRDAISDIEGVMFRVSDEGGRVIVGGDEQEEPLATGDVRVGNLAFIINVWPTTAMRDIYRGVHGYGALFILLLIAIALSLAVYALQRRYVMLKEKDRELTESEHRFRTLVEHSLTGVYLIQDDLFRYVNPRFCEIFGYSSYEIIDRLGPEDLAHPEDWPTVSENLRKRFRGEIGSVNYTFRCLRKDGQVIEVEVHGSRIDWRGRPAVIGTLTDITERINLEKQLLRAQRLESVGLLAGGIAHDFNNILTAITGYASLLEPMLDSPEMKRQVIQIQKASERAATLTRGLLAFSRRQVLQPEPLYIRELMKDFEPILRRVIPENISLTITPSENAPVLADRGQIEQVLMNLVTNARDAMPEGGSLLIESSDVHIGRDYLEMHPWAENEGDYVVISVTDSGIGMDRETQEHVFEPFFTTKEVGKGTGLGLSMVYGIVKQHHGFIHLYSEPGKGTTFRIYLPVTDQIPERKVESGHAGLMGGTELVLIAEDDETVRDVAVQSLSAAGYRVLTAADGKEAETVIRERAGEIDIMLLDVVMPGLGGRELYEIARALDYRGKVLFMSGYTENGRLASFVQSGGVEFIPKPFTASGLLKKVREVLDAR